MKKNKRLKVFSEIEQAVFYSVPNFDNHDREKYLTFSEKELELIMKSKNAHLKIYLAIQLAYFKSNNMFFYLSLSEINKEDILFLITRYFHDVSLPLKVSERYAYYEGKAILLKYFQYNDWSKKYYTICIEQIKEIIQRDISPNFIGRELLKFLKHIKVTCPTYTVLQDLISESLIIERQRISAIIDIEIDIEEKKEILQLMLREEGISRLAELHQDAKNFGFKMMLKEREKHKTLESLYNTAQRVVKKLTISQQNIKYYADLAIYYNSRDLENLGSNQNYLYILCYIFRKYQEVNDNLIEAFRYNTKKIDDTLRAKVKKQFQEERAETENKVGRLLLLYVDENIKDTVEFQKVRKRAFKIMEKEKIGSLGNKLLKKGQYKKESYWKEVDKLQKKHQRNLRPLFKSLKFTSEKGDNKWLVSINWLKTKFDARIINSEDTPLSLPKNSQKYFFNSDKSFNIYRYEYWLYNQIEEKVKSGILYVKDSMLHNCFNNELVGIEKSKEVLKEMDITWTQAPIKNKVNESLTHLDTLWTEINKKYKQGNLKHLKYDKEKKKFIWSKVRSQINEELEHNFYSQLPFCEINEIMSFVNEKTRFLSAFKPLQNRYFKKETVREDKLKAAILSRALNYGDYKMSQSSDVTYRELKTTSSQTLRLSTLRESNDILSDAILNLPIYPYYSIDFELLFSSVDGQKYELETPNIKARNSKKYLREKPGVSAYTILANNIPFNCYTIGSNEHESYYVFDIWYNNTTNIEPQIITGDMHSMNKANFAILDWFGAQYKPRFTNLNTQLKNIYCAKNIEKYSSEPLSPTGEIDSKIIINTEEKINQIIATLGLKEMNQANLMKKLCNLPLENPLRKAVFEYDKLIRSIYTLEYMMDFQLQRNVNKSQNRIEAYHQLRATIAKIGGRKQLYGKTNIDIEISNQCGRLIANIVIYYNSLILSGLLEQNPELKTNKKFLNMLKKISPIAWQHIHFLGQYIFKTNEQSINLAEILKDIKLEF